jgi:hypothetical protein
MAQKKYEDQWNRIEDPNMNPHSYTHLIFDKAPKIYNGEKTASSTNAAGKSDIGKDFLSRTQEVQQLREAINKWDYMKLKSFCTTKEVVSKPKRPPTEWEKILASYTSDKGLIIRIYREFKKLNFPKINEPIKKWATVLNRTFSKEEV